MNTYVIAKIIYSVGLFFNMIGAGLVAWEVINQYKSKKYSSRDNNITGGIDADRSPIDTAGSKKWTLVKYRYMRIGLILLLFGFGLQIVSNWIN
ncbi:MAG: hypothetical protein ACUZ8N_04040 [Candidatus Scalindua sp.]